MKPYRRPLFARMTFQAQLKLRAFRSRCQAAARAFMACPMPAYAVIYDRGNPHDEASEEYYGYFGSPEEAVAMFNECYPPDTGEAHTAFLVRLERKLRSHPDELKESTNATVPG